MSRAKEVIQRSMHSLGFEVSRLESTRHPPATRRRPIADLDLFFEDLAARGFRPRHILDVGANQGDWSRAAAKVWNTARFTLIEPQIEMKPHLDDFCEGQPGSEWLNVGAGAEAAELKLNIFADRGACTFEEIADENAGARLEQRVVPVITLDSLRDGRLAEVPELVKLDVEGFELQALEGASSLLGEVEVFLLELSFFEFRAGHPTFSKVVGIMDDHGYQPYDITFYKRRPLDGALGLVEMAFARTDGMLRSSNDWQ